MRAAETRNAPITPIALARTFVGKNERRDGRVIGAFIEQMTGTRIDPAQTAWCAAFANAVLQANGHEGTGTLTARSFLDFGTAVERPQEGDIAVFWRESPESWKGHVGFFAGYRTRNGRRYVRVVGGNQDDSVSEKLYPAGRLLGFRRPERAPV